ncbi:MAG: hypothetical protein JRF63_02725 [Deltaproteobacteria bacterium]|nr:hypothetical protein [Deltaproteobacteria bacterium]
MAKPDTIDRHELARLLPDEVRGWAPGRDDGLYDHETLYELIDGGAEVYRALNVRTVLSREYRKPGATDIIVDVFDMGSAADAFGAFHHDMREGEDAGVGDESEAFGGSIAFWRDRYFVSEVALDDDTATCDAMRELGFAISAAIPSSGQPPKLVRALPAAGLVTSHVHYFHDKALLDRHLFLGEENVLGLDRETEGVVARYHLGELAGVDAGRATALLLVRYPSASRAVRAHAGLGAVQDLSAGELRGKLIAAVFGAPNSRLAEQLINSVEPIE